LTDKGKEFYSQVFDAICQLLDIERINTTPRHPECDGQTEKNIQHLKKMMRAYVNEKQSNWDQGLSQLAYAYNTSVHETIGLTPFEVMFGRKPRIPIDLFYPNTNEMNRPVIEESKTIQLADVQNKLSISSVSNDQSIDVLGDLMLVNHPELKKGLARSLAPRYNGPFKIVGKYKNGCDYLIRENGHPRARVKQIHRNRLIAYFKRGHPHDRSIETHESTHENTTKKKRSYTKNPDCKRWAKHQESPSESATEVESSDNEHSSTEEFPAAQNNEPNHLQQNLKELKPGRPPKKKVNKQSNEHNCNTKPAVVEAKRIRKPPDRIARA
jgi:hypothetical protein